MAETPKLINSFLVEVFNDILKIEENFIIKTFKDLSVNEMHIIEQIFLAEENSEDTRVTEIAKKRRVTAGTLTSAIIPLEKKGYIIREKAENDKRVVKLKCSEKARNAQALHEEFHRDMVSGVLSGLSEDQAYLLADTLSDLRTFFQEKYGE
ncbi:MAG: MarR family transcriptional regulator [Ruminococcaceae bacterium]|nr:MarR family transcriptional regulator [Oscillospiraceae bacterium]